MVLAIRRADHERSAGGGDLLVKERKTSDEVIKSIKTWLNQVLTVMSKQLQGGKHGKAAMCQFAVGVFLQLY